MAHNSTEFKQMFLRREIMDQGYDSQLFSLFYTWKANQEPIQAIQFEDLKEVVQDFKKQYDPTKPVVRPQEEVPECQQNIPPSLPQPQKAQKIPVTDQNQQESPIQSQGSFKFYQNSQEYLKPAFTIQCIIANKTPCSQLETIQILIGDPQQIQGGVFKQKKTLYLIDTKPLNWSVKRSFKQFEWLRQSLLKTYLGNYIPPLIKSPTNQKFYLQSFIEGICRNKLLMTSFDFIAFLKENNPKVFEGHQKASKKNKRPQSVQRIQSISGQLQCDIQNHQQYISQLELFKNKNQAMMRELEIKSQSISKEIQNLAYSLSSFSDLLTDVENIQAHLPNHFENKLIYENLSSTVAVWSQRVMGQAEMLNEFSCFFRYTNAEMKALRPIMKERNINMQAFRKNQDYSCKDSYGYYNHQCISQIQRVARESTEEARKRFLNLSRKFGDHHTELHLMWTELMARMTDLYVQEMVKFQKNQVFILFDV